MDNVTDNKNNWLLHSLIDESSVLLRQNNGVVGENNAIYKFVAEQAKAIGISMDNIEVSISDAPSFKDYMNLVPNSKTGRDTIVIGSDYFSKVSSVVGEDVAISAIRGGMKHELSHSEREPILIGSIVSNAGANKLRRLEECRADFFADNDAVNFLRVTSYLSPKVYFETGKNSNYPPTRDRLRAAALRKFTEQESGEKIVLPYLNISHDCNFSITDKQKLDSINPYAMDRAKHLTEEFMRKLDVEISNIQISAIVSNTQNALVAAGSEREKGRHSSR